MNILDRVSSKLVDIVNMIDDEIDSSDVRSESMEIILEDAESLQRKVMNLQELWEADDEEPDWERSDR